MVDREGCREPEGRSLAGRALGADLAAHQLDEARGDRQPEAGSLVAARRGGIDLREFVEHRLQLVGGDTDAGILDTDPDSDLLIFAFAGDVDEHVAALGELHRIADKVGRDLAETPDIADHRLRQFRIDAHDEFEVLLRDARRNQRRHVLDRLAEAEWRGIELELSGVDLGEIEDVIDDRQKGVARLHDDVDEHALALVELGPRQKLGHAEHAVHRGADLVTHIGEELGLRAVRRFGNRAGRLERCVGLAQTLVGLGDPAQHRLEDAQAKQSGERNDHQGDDHQCVLQRAVAFDHIGMQSFERRLEVWPYPLAGGFLQLGEDTLRGWQGIVAEDVEPVGVGKDLADVLLERVDPARAVPDFADGCRHRPTGDSGEHRFDREGRRVGAVLLRRDRLALAHADIVVGGPTKRLVGAVEAFDSGAELVPDRGAGGVRRLPALIIGKDRGRAGRRGVDATVVEPHGLVDDVSGRVGHECHDRAEAHIVLGDLGLPEEIGRAGRDSDDESRQDRKKAAAHIGARYD